MNRVVVGSVLSLTLTVSPMHAQVVSDGATVTLANVTNTITGTITVGANGPFTLLTLADNALLTNSAHGVIGRNATANSNAVQLLSASARWLMGNNLFVGSNGAFNRLGSMEAFSLGHLVVNVAAIEHRTGLLLAIPWGQASLDSILAIPQNLWVISVHSPN